ncbi:LytR/AlgR family response regulator transcription factor [Pseudoalteromonas luteoviolacea]|uniref:HTH LytTR-type domain-containing protein n=1 Tax=Pseudoalteromonas luteoviolacea S4054 TaxID=1129367 RepID=A0A0F6ADB3_9GAMM|nr:LytTR family DNA-binding domain-containing protein [Pseudoalteromonas luteoviolacea]AOT06874.1 histidine kinase [Pseudoalteromonas luteoviolacea]AOT11792.1 histidine kinase [Pseudoalteromonas luteoviolacea]AOT16704.1 histidine kinase [Pseudoalteromonas luteoviolacea]KKE83369.1 hypothetical protein N479_14600 [Pseudoalteromonas luteoviolacea S4054]KZN74014.1 hypothetical protein N481_09885 [Pseudoalteromonas luteoviolacea S4047-1]
MNSHFVFYFVATLFFSCFVSVAYGSQQLVPFDRSAEVTVCPYITSEPPDFLSPACKVTQLSKLDPQNQAIWVKLEFERTQRLTELSPPYGLFLFAKAASRVYLNGVLIGQNGQPAADKSEQMGKMDQVMYVPEEILVSQNKLVLALSAHHSLITLDYPVHYLGIGEYGDPKQYIQSFSRLGLILIGAFLLGALYFLTISFRHQGRRNFKLFSALCLLAALQLGTEMSRGLFNYDYLWQDIRLLLVVGLSFLFGVILLIYSSFKVAGSRAWHWIYIGGFLSLSAVLFAPGFDVKATAGIFIPLLFSLVQIALFWWQSRDTSLLNWFVVQCTVAITICLAAASFHEIIYFVIIALLLAFLFVRQAREYNLQQAQYFRDQSHIAKLELKLAQNQQSHSPTKLELSVAGKTDYVTMTDIAYCKAAGDYVELYMKNGTDKLYSGPLKQLESSLPSMFVKTHRSYLVNLNEVLTLHSANNQHALLLTVGETVPVSRRLVPSVRATLKESVN